MLALPIDRTTSISELGEGLAEIAEELRALNGGVALLCRSAAGESVVPKLASDLFELTRILPVDLIEIGFDGGIVAACNEALRRAREARTGIFLLQAGARLTAGSLSEMRDVADTDPMIGFVGAPTNSGAITGAPLQHAHAFGSAVEARRAYDHIHPYLPRVSYVAAASGPCLYIKPSMLLEFGDLDPSYSTLSAAQDEFMMRCNLRGYRAALANRAYVHQASDARDDAAHTDDRARDYRRLGKAHPHFHRAMLRTLDSTEFKAKRLLAGLAPDSHGRRRILFESSQLGAFFNGTFAVTVKLVTRFVEQFSSRYECWISCNAEAFRFHGLDRVSGLRYAGDLAQAGLHGPYLAALRLAQPFSLPDLIHLGSLAPLSGFLMLDTIAMDCQNLDVHDLRMVWDHMAHTVSMVGYISQFTADQLNRRVAIPDSVAQATILLSTDPAEYVTPAEEPKGSDYLLLVGNEYSHKHLRETIDLFRSRPNRPPLVVLGLKLHGEPGITSYASGDLDDDFVERLYRNAIAIVFPTHYEGFGMPVIHALGYRKAVFARAISVLQEIRNRAPGGSNIHLFASTQEIVDAALADTSWQDDAAESVDVQTWANAARQIESLISQSQSKLSYVNLHERMLAVCACEAMHDPSLLRLARRKLVESYLIRGVHAWLSFTPGSRPHRTARRVTQAVADLMRDD